MWIKFITIWIILVHRGSTLKKIYKKIKLTLIFELFDKYFLKIN